MRGRYTIIGNGRDIVKGVLRAPIRALKGTNCDYMNLEFVDKD